MKFECHGHIILNGESYKESIAAHKNGADDSRIRENLKILAAQGVSFFRDGGDNLSVSLRAKDLAPEYNIDYRTPVFMIYKKGSYGAMFGKAFESLRECRSLILEAKRAGADFIKFSSGGILDFSSDGKVTGVSLSRFEMKELINISHSEGFRVMVHCNGASNIKAAIESGADSIEHGFYADIECARMLSDSSCLWVPTCVAVDNFGMISRFGSETVRKAAAAQALVIAEAYRLGGLIGSGSDSGAYGVPHGFGTLAEYELLGALNVDPEKGNRKIAELFSVT